MAEIHVLDKHTAELIAAGEVVERPASVVKELLENSIDAGASQITVSIESGGVRLIEISDNGTGIEAKYIPTAFIRHATSKIRTEEDLTSIHTLGFRGEALASIASVARVEVLTRTEADECASLYRIEGGEEQPIEPGARGVGTTIRVCDLFFNTPARMKFLKKDSSEGTFVADIVGHVALSHPEVSFKFIREGKLQYVTPGDGQLRSAAYAVLGREFSRDLVEVDNREGVYRVWGLITQPRSCRAAAVHNARLAIGGIDEALPLPHVQRRKRKARIPVVHRGKAHADGERPAEREQNDRAAELFRSQTDQPDREEEKHRPDRGIWVFQRNRAVGKACHDAENSEHETRRPRQKPPKSDSDRAPHAGRDCRHKSRGENPAHEPQAERVCQKARYRHQFKVVCTDWKRKRA